MARSAYCPEVGPGPVGRALGAAIVADVQRGRLTAGERLPGSRTLATRLSIARGTVTSVLETLVAEGWLERRASQGTFVCGSLPIGPLPAAEHGGGLGFALHPGPESRRLHTPRDVRFALVGGKPDLRLLPLADLARAYGRVLRGRGRRLVDYGPPGGTDRLKRSLANWLADTRGIRPVVGGILVTRGSQQALYLCARAVLRPGDRVAVEALGYPPAWEAMRSMGAELVPIAVDDDGMAVESIPDDVRAVYLTPHHQYPTGASLSAERRLRLLTWAAKNRVAIFEDDYDHEYHYDGPPRLPLAAHDKAGVVVSLGTLSKAFAPGLRLGWVVASPEFIALLVRWRTVMDRQGDQVVEHAVAELLDDGTLARHLRRTLQTYRERRDVLMALVAAKLPGLTVLPRPGGLALWCAAEGTDVDAWAERCLAAGVYFETASSYTLDRSAQPFVRLGFAGHTPAELTEAVGILADCYEALPTNRNNV
jgi:GntR family transcriptional regulator / MocR family aminotransferase